MAKMFYSREELQEKLSCSSEQVDQFIQEGRLREFRDGPKIMFKASDVDALDSSAFSTDKQGLGDTPLAGDSSDEISLTPEDSADQIGLVPSDTGSQIGLIPGDTGDQINLDDTTGTDDDKDDTVVSGGSSGIDVLAGSDAPLIDPLAQTQIAPDLLDQIDLDSGSSGSGLLDLSREADDTSLGAELLEEIYPGAEEGAVETQMPSQLEVDTGATTAASGASMETEAILSTSKIAMIEIVDPTSGSYGIMMIVPFILLIYLACVATANISDIRPKLLDNLAQYNLWVTVGAVVVSLVVFGIGWFLQSSAGKTPTKPKPQKQPKKAKPAKKKK